MVVTDIRKIDDKRFCLFVDYEPYASIYLSDIKRLHLKCGEEIADDKLECFRREYLYKRAMNKAVNSIKFSDKCEYDIRNKLKDLYYDEEIINHTVERLKSYGYIDDYRYTESYIRRHSAKKGLRVISMELQAKHIDRTIIDDVLENNEIPDEMERIAGIIRKKYTVADLINKRDKVLSYMYSKGFSSRKVSECIKLIINDTSEEDNNYTDV